MSNETRGKKNDAGKPDLSMIPAEAERQEALGFMLGEAKYGRDNYRKGMEAHRLVAAAKRHLNAWFSGETFDPDPKAKELGLPVTHLGNARCCLAMLIELEKNGKLVDDRYKGEPSDLDDGVALSHIQEGYWSRLDLYGRPGNDEETSFLKKNDKGEWEAFYPDQCQRRGSFYGLGEDFRQAHDELKRPREGREFYLYKFLGTEKPKEQK